MVTIVQYCDVCDKTEGHLFLKWLSMSLQDVIRSVIPTVTSRGVSVWLQRADPLLQQWMRILTARWWKDHRLRLEAIRSDESPFFHILDEWARAWVAYTERTEGAGLNAWPLAAQRVLCRAPRPLSLCKWEQSFAEWSRNDTTGEFSSRRAVLPTTGGKEGHRMRMQRITGSDLTPTRLSAGESLWPKTIYRILQRQPKTTNGQIFL